MAKLDRSRVVELLARLGGADDRSVLEAARELDRMVAESGLTWDAVVRADWDATGDGEAGRDEPFEETGDQRLEADGEVSDAGKAEATRLIGRLLARKDISENLRDDLTEFKRAIAEGSFDAADNRYVRALARRLGA